MQNAVAITQSSHSLTVEQMRIDSRHLWRYIRAQPERAPSQLIDQLEGPQIKVAARSSQQRIEILKHRGDDVFVSMSTKQIQNRSSQAFDPRRFVGQRIGDMFR